MSHIERRFGRIPFAHTQLSLQDQAAKRHTTVNPGLSVHIACRNPLQITRTIESGEDFIPPRRQVSRDRHFPKFSISKTTIPEAGWQAGAQRSLVIHPPVAAVMVSKLQKLQVVRASIFIATPGKRNPQGSPAWARSGKSTVSRANPLSNTASAAVDVSADSAGKTNSPSTTCVSSNSS